MKNRVEAMPPVIDTSGFLDFMSKQALVIDPRSQLDIVKNIDWYDDYASRLYILSGEEGLFISPAEIPAEFIDYYRRVLDLKTAPPERIIKIDKGGTENTLEKRLGENATNLMMLDNLRGRTIIPYAMTPEVELLASRHGLSVLSGGDTMDGLSDKANFQSYLAEISPEIKELTGFDIAIDTSPVFVACDRYAAEEAYRQINFDGSRTVIIAKSKGHSALSVFRVTPADGVEAVHEIIGSRFKPSDRILIQEFVEHDDSPSMQGVRMLGEPYRQLYSGIQYMRDDGPGFLYTGNGFPFRGHNVKIAPAEIDRIREVHEHLGEIVLKHHNIHGLVGFDAVIGLSEGKINKLKVTEMNHHIPGSTVVYAAAMKIFPDGFSGVARTWKVKFAKGQTPAELIESYADLLVKEQGTYGMLPCINWEDRVDFVVFAPDQEALNHLTNEIEEREPRKG